MYQHDSRKIKPGDIFICLPGGEKYLQAAYDNGAKSHINCSREEMSALAAKHFGYPSKNLTVIGITGTNGKTTVATIINEVLSNTGHKSAYLGTINSNLTTPESLELQELMAQHLKGGGTHFVMEVSSHGIDQERIHNIAFDII